jgi:hypothetical protein
MILLVWAKYVLALQYIKRGDGDVTIYWKLATTVLCQKIE